MAETDPTFDRWRGEISVKVADHDRRLGEQHADIRELRVSSSAATIEIAKLGASVEGMRGDLSRALAEQAKQRQDEFAELQATVAANRLTPKEKIAAVLVPIAVACLSALVLLISSHTI